jgi:xanthine dehydrogenase YagR molybdenum-binding subunit
MSVIESVMETIAKALPNKKPDPLIAHTGYVGKPYDRVDGRDKVQGEARFSAEFKVDNPAYAVPVYSAIAKGKIRKIDSGPAERAPGVVAVITYQNIPRMKTPPIVDFHNIGKGFALSDLPIMQNAEVHWDGEPVALAVAETLEQAEHAASLISVEYDVDTADLSFEETKPKAFVPSDILGEPPEINIGDANKALAEAEVSVGHLYKTPRYNHNAIEPHATIAFWDDRGAMVVFDATQSVNLTAHTLAYIFDMKVEDVRVVAPFLGGGLRGLRRQDRLEQYCALRSGCEGSRSSCKARVVARRNFSHDRRPHAFRTTRGFRSGEERQADGSDPYRTDGNSSERALRRAVYVSAAAPLCEPESACGTEGDVSGHCRQYVDARSG